MSCCDEKIICNSSCHNTGDCNMENCVCCDCECSSTSCEKCSKNDCCKKIELNCSDCDCLKECCEISGTDNCSVCENDCDNEQFIYELMKNSNCCKKLLEDGEVQDQVNILREKIREKLSNESNNNLKSHLRHGVFLECF